MSNMEELKYANKEFELVYTIKDGILNKLVIWREERVISAPICLQSDSSNHSLTFLFRFVAFGHLSFITPVFRISLKCLTCSTHQSICDNLIVLTVSFFWFLLVWFLLHS